MKTGSTSRRLRCELVTSPVRLTTLSRSRSASILSTLTSGTPVRRQTQPQFKGDSRGTETDCGAVRSCFSASECCIRGAHSRPHRSPVGVEPDEGRRGTRGIGAVHCNTRGFEPNRRTAVQLQSVSDACCGERVVLSSRGRRDRTENRVRASALDSSDQQREHGSRRTVVRVASRHG